MIQVDARGLSCPEPVLLTLDALDSANGEAVQVTVSDSNQRDNIMRQVERRKLTANVEKVGQDFVLTIE